MFTLDDVDWNQIPPDNNTGIQFPRRSCTPPGRWPSVTRTSLQADSPELASAALTPKADVANDSSARLRAVS